MSEEQIHWITSNIRIVLAMACPFALGILWILFRLAWKRRFTLQELMWLVTFFAFACGFAIWLRYGRLMPIPGSDSEMESIEELRLKL